MTTVQKCLQLRNRGAHGPLWAPPSPPACESRSAVHQAVAYGLAMMDLDPGQSVDLDEPILRCYQIRRVAAAMVDESGLLFLPVHDLSLHALRRICETRRQRPRNMVRHGLDRLVGQGDGTRALADLCCRRVRLLEDEILDVALGCGLHRAGRHRDVGLERHESARPWLAGRPDRRGYFCRADGRAMARTGALRNGVHAVIRRSGPARLTAPLSQTPLKLNRDPALTWHAAEYAFGRCPSERLYWAD